MGETDFIPLDAVFGGRLQRDFILPVEGKPRLNVLGGNLPYAAAGYALWGGKAGLVARINREFPLAWLEQLNQAGFDTSGIRTINEPLDDRRFIVYLDPLTPRMDSPLTYFAERGIPFPRELIGYETAEPRFCSKVEYAPYSVHVNDIPRLYMDAPAAHICPIDFMSHKIMPSLLKTGLVDTLSMRSTACYMDPTYWEDIRGLIADLTIFMTTEAEAKRLFQGRSVDVWEIAAGLADYGPQIVVVNMPDGSAWVYSRLQAKRWIVPTYPTRVVDPTGMLDAFDGAFLFAYRQNFDPVEAALHGSITAALCLEGSGPFYILDTLPGLKEARLEALRPRVRVI